MKSSEVIERAVAYGRLVLVDREFKPLSPERMEKIGSKNPIHVATKTDVGKIGVLVSAKSKTDFLISENGLRYLAEAEREGRIAVGVVVLIANWRAAANADHAEAILDKLRDVPTHGGFFGPFWPVDREFVPVRANVASDEEAF
jgi:hypothetical protein